MEYTKQHIFKILTTRDKISASEAWDIIEACQEDIEWALTEGDHDAAEDALRDHLGLEPDFIMVFI